MTYTVAFIGLGLMGLPMASRLIKAGHRVVGYDLKPDNLDKAVQIGIEVSPGAASASEQADFVITMVLSGTDVRRVFIEDGVIGRAKKGALFIDCSTIDRGSSSSVREVAVAAGYGMIDAPVSGGVKRAADGALTIMVGGLTEDFLRAEPILSALGTEIHHMGDPGSGLAAKICNNLVAGISIVAVAEAFALAKKLELDTHKLFEVMTNSTAKCWALDVMCPVPGPVPSSPANYDFHAAAAASLLVKDLGVAQQTALQSGATVALGSLAQAIYSIYCNTGRQNLDASGVIQLFDHMNLDRPLPN